MRTNSWRRRNIPYSESWPHFSAVGRQSAITELKRDPALNRFTTAVVLWCCRAVPTKVRYRMGGFLYMGGVILRSARTVGPETPSRLYKAYIYMWNKIKDTAVVQTIVCGTAYGSNIMRTYGTLDELPLNLTLTPPLALTSALVPTATAALGRPVWKSSGYNPGKIVFLEKKPDQIMIDTHCFCPFEYYISYSYSRVPPTLLPETEKWWQLPLPPGPPCNSLLRSVKYFSTKMISFLHYPRRHECTVILK